MEAPLVGCLKELQDLLFVAFIAQIIRYGELAVFLKLIPIVLYLTNQIK